MPPERIMVVVPTLDRWVTDSIATFFAKCVYKSFDSSYPYEIAPSTLAKVRGYAIMRNMAVKRLLDSPFDRLWFIDNDTILPEDVFELPKVDADVVTLPYPFVGTMCPAICNYRDIDDFSKGMKDIEPDENGLADVNGTGMGCTLIRRHVLEDKAMHWERDFMTQDGTRMTLPPEAPPPVFRYHMAPNGMTTMGEDFDFCSRGS